MVARPRNPVSVELPDGSQTNLLSSSAAGPHVGAGPPMSTGGVIIEKMESGELPPSPFAGRKSWNIDFPGFDNKDGNNEKSKNNDQDETAIDYIIWVMHKGYSFLQPSQGSWKKQMIRISVLVAILLLVVWIAHAV